MNIIYFLLFLASISIFLFLLNFSRYIRISTYYSKYKINCNSKNYTANIEFYPAVTRLFENADTNRVDLTNCNLISEHLQEKIYEQELCNCFEKTKAKFKDRLFRPWYVLVPKYPQDSHAKNTIITLAKSVLFFLISQVFSNVLAASGIGDILWDMLVSKFPLISGLITQLALF